MIILTISSCLSAPMLSPEDYYLQATDELSRRKNPEGALENLNHAIARRPDYVEAIMLRGAVHRILQNPAEAIGDFEVVTALSPQFLPARLNLGILYREAKRHAEAERELTEAIRLQPHFVEAYLHRSELFREQGREEEAQNDIEKARKIGAQMAERFFTQAVQEYRLQKWDRAMRNFNFTLALDPDHVAARISRGALFLKDGEIEKALEDLHHACRRDPKNYDARFFRASAFLARRDFDRCAKDLKAAVKMDPRRPEAFRLRGIVRMEHLDDPDGAGEDFARVVKLDPSPESHEMLGQLYESQKLYSDAEREYVRSQKLRATAHGMHRLARLYILMDNKKSAAQCYKHAIKLCTEGAYRKELKSELEDLREGGRNTPQNEQEN